VEESEVIEEFVVEVEVTHEVGNGLSVRLVREAYAEVSVDTTHSVQHKQ